MGDLHKLRFKNDTAETAVAPVDAQNRNRLYFFATTAATGMVQILSSSLVTI